jgi:sulfhydrogenase subunit delta
VKPKIAIFDLTDCEGCELELINLREKLVVLSGEADIANWRFASDTHDQGPFDITFIEGSPITEGDIELIKQVRAVSRYVVSLGSCADLGGLQAGLNKNEWEKGIKEVYGEKYKTKSKAPKPLSYYIEVDVHLPGCPVNQDELAQVFSALISLKKPEKAAYTVCLECKAKENACLYLKGEPCIGPITKGGCDAVCPSRGLRCWGCFGVLEGANYTAFSKNLEKKYGKEKAKMYLKSYFSQEEG